MPAAGRGLFALATLPIGTVLPPYSGQEVDLESGGGAGRLRLLRARLARALVKL